MHVSIQPLRSKEQQHAFQHATSAEVCRATARRGARRLTRFAHWTLGEDLTNWRRAHRDQTSRSGSKGFSRATKERTAIVDLQQRVNRRCCSTDGSEKDLLRRTIRRFDNSIEHPERNSTDWMKWSFREAKRNLFFSPIFAGLWHCSPNHCKSVADGWHSPISKWFSRSDQERREESAHPSSWKSVRRTPSDSHVDRRDRFRRRGRSWGNGRCSTACIELQVRSLVRSHRSRPIDCRDAGKRRENLSYAFGHMGFVPRRDAVLFTNFDKMQQQLYPAQERQTSRRTAKKSVAVQTPRLARLRHVHSSSSHGTDLSLSLSL